MHLPGWVGSTPRKKLEVIFEKYTHLQINLVFTGDSIESLVYDVLQLNVLHTDRLMIQLARYSRYRSLSDLKSFYLKWLEREFTDRKVRGPNPTSASRHPLSRLGQPGSIPAIVLPSGGMAARHRKGATVEQLLLLFLYSWRRQKAVISLAIRAFTSLPTIIMMAMRMLQTIGQEKKLSYASCLQKLNIHLLLECVFMKFSGYLLTVTQMQASVTKDAKRIYEKTYYSYVLSVVSTGAPVDILVHPTKITTRNRDQFDETPNQQLSGIIILRTTAPVT
ncbi:hypothetical protein T265_13887, partial [Opisthorchis viverrini]